MNARLAIGWALAVGLVIPVAHGAPALYQGEGSWGAITGASADIAPPALGWVFQDGAWLGRLPANADSLSVGAERLAIADARLAPPPTVVLPKERNAFGPCAVRSLSMRYDEAARSRRWTIIFSDDPALEPAFFLPSLVVRPVLELEDIQTGQRWPLQPTRRGREGGRFPTRHDPRYYGGTLDDDDIEWSMMVIPLENGRRILQGRIMLQKSDTRLFRLRVGLVTGTPGKAVLQDENPPAVVSASAGQAVGLFPDLAEPRRSRVVTIPGQGPAIEMDLAVTKATGNFPRRVTFSFEAETWPSTDVAAATQEAVAKLARTGGAVPVPDAVLRAGPDALPAYDLICHRLTFPGGFANAQDAFQFLQLNMSSLFADSADSASAYLSVAHTAAGEPLVELIPDGAQVAVNPDPDLEALLELGQNRGQTLLASINRQRAGAVWIRLGPFADDLDCSARGLYMADYPAAWPAGVAKPGVVLGHAAAEWVSSLSCLLRKANTCLLVEDTSTLAPYTTVYADALVCTSADPAEMRRQHALAGPRPVLWAARQSTAAANALAHDLGFVTWRQINDN
ncbi:MAG TPA: hypothetical protein PLD40_07195 [Kiritimatiellia bacterium]|nr:hypothetical protein [Kiritimatiellia bacterium]